MSPLISFRHGLLALALTACAIDDRDSTTGVDRNEPNGSGGTSPDAGNVMTLQGGGEGTSPTDLEPTDGVMANACATANGGCDALTTCAAGPEGAICGACPAGYTGDGTSGCVDVNECEGDAACAPDTVCLNKAGSHSCETCPGQVIDGVCTCGAAGAECRDVDECETENGGCDPLVACVNTLEGRTCGDCPQGYTGDGELGCADVDECLIDNGGCDPVVACSNAPGSFSCGPCPSGFSGTGASGCTDINECATNRGGCDALVDCVNSPGSYTCGSCPSGFSGGGSTGCTDVNECLTNNGGCDPRTTCTNTPGGRTCGACPRGFSGSGQAGCTDIDECSADTHDCFADSGCVNQTGTFSCVCPAFFAGDGRSCTGAPKEFGYLQMITGDGALYVWNVSTRNNVATAIPGVSYASFGTGAVACGVSSAGALFCWDYATPSSPVRIGNASNWQKLEGSITAFCGIQSGGNLSCWENGNGAAGSGSISAVAPVAVSPQGNWSTVSVGDYNGKCGIRSGQLFCWGRNVRGMLGIGAGIDTSDLRHDTPQRVGNASDWSSVSVGEAHACGIRNGSLFCWGAAFANAQADDVDAPVRVGTATDWVAVAAGVAHSVGLRSNGQLFYWGQGFFGAFPTDSQSPLRVGSDRSWQAPIYADYALSCATSEGVPYCFGSDANTDLDLPPADVPVRIRL